MLSLERRLSGPARGYLFRTPVIRSVLKLGRFYLSDGGEPAPLDRMRQGVEEALDHRGTLLFYPEGTRTKTGEIGDFHLGAFRMAVEYKLPIQPVVIDGLDQVFPPGKRDRADAGQVSRAGSLSRSDRAAVRRGARSGASCASSPSRCGSRWSKNWPGSGRSGDRLDGSSRRMRSEPILGGRNSTKSPG